MAKKTTPQKEETLTIRKLMERRCCCKNCKHSRLVRSKVGNPVLCECQLTWEQEAKMGLFHRNPNVDLTVCLLWEEDPTGMKPIYPLTPNPHA